VRVLAEGRASEILELGEDRVLRRFKAGGRPAREAEIMEHARAGGYPVPRVLEVHDDALVLERIDGPTMLAALRRRPWQMARQARTLAELHHRLHEIPFEGERLIHLDFHPDNVLLSQRGPVVIDWTNSRAGDPALDVALTWVICATSGGALGRTVLPPARRSGRGSRSASCRCGVPRRRLERDRRRTRARTGPRP
jgi:aminoglycoside phosphotransferase (APT) family kinase protein